MERTAVDTEDAGAGNGKKGAGAVLENPRRRAGESHDDFGRLAEWPQIHETVPDRKTIESTPGVCEGMSILVVDDEDDLRRLLCRALRQDGYRVFEAGNGEDALDVAARHGKDLRLLVTDLRMPGMNGRELAERLTQEWPGLPVLYISGFSEVAPEPGVPFLRKPFRLDALKREIRKLVVTDPRRKPIDSARNDSGPGRDRKRGG